MKTYEEARKTIQEIEAIERWEVKVATVVDTLSSAALYNLWSTLLSTKKNKPLKKSYWRTKEGEKRVQKMLDVIGEAARSKEEPLPASLMSDCIRRFQE